MKDAFWSDAGEEPMPKRRGPKREERVGGVRPVVVLCARSLERRARSGRRRGGMGRVGGCSVF